MSSSLNKQIIDLAVQLCIWLYITFDCLWLFVFVLYLYTSQITPPPPPPPPPTPPPACQNLQNYFVKILFSLLEITFNVEDG